MKMQTITELYQGHQYDPQEVMDAIDHFEKAGWSVRQIIAIGSDVYVVYERGETS